MATATKDPRLVARVDSQLHKHIAQAAALAGASVSQFLIDAVREKADQTIERHTRIQVSRESAERMLQALDAPANPSPRLIAAARRYEELNIDESELPGNFQRT